jgi:hypothetical protein
MNKEYYNKLINEEINYLLEQEELLNEEITSIATTFEYHSIEDNVNLGRLEISAINEKRQHIFTITELIHELDNLKKESDK